jgi:hypothetical protein
MQFLLLDLCALKNLRSSTALPGSRLSTELKIHFMPYQSVRVQQALDKTDEGQCQQGYKSKLQDVWPDLNINQGFLCLSRDTETLSIRRL